MLFRTNPKPTKPGAPGPGLKKKNWKPVVKRWLKGRKIFLHTDGARSYKIGINRKDQQPGVVHDYVVHKPKRHSNGKPMKATYVQLFGLGHQIGVGDRSVTPKSAAPHGNKDGTSGR